VNLFTNSIEAMDGQGEISLSLSDDGRMATLNISDTGPGFSPEVMERLFDPFFTTRASGTGLGLAVCRKIVEGYGGTIEAANCADRGAGVRITLPLSPEVR
jgi:signal transduction histidine kinase